MLITFIALVCFDTSSIACISMSKEHDSQKHNLSQGLGYFLESLLDEFSYSLLDDPSNLSMKGD
jgi:hypothetical protein